MRCLSCKPNIYVSWSKSELRVGLSPLNQFKPSSKIFYWPFQGCSSFVDLLCFLCLVFSMPLWASVYMCLVVTCWERADLLAIVCGVQLWVCQFPIGILGQVLYLIVSITDLCTLIYLGTMYMRTVLRTPRFSRVKQPEKLFHSALMLYKPWWHGWTFGWCMQFVWKRNFIAVKDVLE